MPIPTPARRATYPKSTPATEQVRAQATNGGSLHLVQLDLASLPSVRRCADGLLAAGKSFDILIANAQAIDEVIPAPQ